MKSIKITLQSFVLILFLSLAACAPVIGPAAASSPPAPATGPTNGTTTGTPCGCSAEGTSTFVAAGPAIPASNETPTPQGSPASLESFKDQWTAYQDASQGFSFEYPAVYDSPQYSYCTVRMQKTPPAGTLVGLDLGSRTALTIIKINEESLQSAAQAFQTGPALKDAQFQAPKETSVSGVPALSLPYTLNGSPGEATFFVKDGLLYQVTTGSPSACDVAAIGLKEADAYSRLLQSFQFRK